MVRTVILHLLLGGLLRIHTSSRPEARGACYVALWRLPRPDFHRLVDTDFQDTPLALQPGDSLTIPWMALSIDFMRFVSSPHAIPATGL